MLNIPRMDDLTFDLLFERAKAMIPTLTKEWTDLNLHDPGITTLQTFAWLYDMLNYYMNATGEVHRLKYLKLLGLSSSAKAARCLITLPALNEPMLLQAGTPFFAGDTRFEVEDTTYVRPNRLLHLLNHAGEHIYDLTAFVQDGDGAEVFSLNSQSRATLYLCFQAQFSGNFAFYSIIKPNKRNPFQNSFTLANCEWEYYNGASWEKAVVVRDETCGFLQNGLIEFMVASAAGMMDHPMFAPGYYLRCRITHNEYDVLPKIMRIEPNFVWASQVKTHAFCKLLDAGERVGIDRYLDEDMLITVALKQEDCYAQAYLYQENEHDHVTLIETDAGREIVFDRGHAPAPVMVFGIMADVMNDVMLGRTDGTAGQTFEFIFPDVIEIGVALVGKTADGRYTFDPWQACEDITCAGYGDRVFQYVKEEGVIRFGDSIHGVVPDAGQGVMVVHLKTSLQDGGNVLAGQIDRLALSPKTEVTNPQPAFGGARKKSASELYEQIEQCMNRVTRAVTEYDYRELVQNTPGLLIDGVSVITMEEYSRFYKIPYRPNTVILAVKPFSCEPYPVLSASYRRMILEHLWNYRLLTTDIDVVSCTYVGVNVHGRIALHDNNEKNRQSVRSCIKEFVDRADTVDFGVPVDFGRLFSALEMVESVRSIAELSLEYVGVGGYKNEQGDIVIFRDSLSYLREIGIEFS